MSMRFLFTNFFVERRQCVYLMFLLMFDVLALSVVSVKSADNVGFDVPALVVAEPIDAQYVPSPKGTGRFVRIQVPVSVFELPGFRGSVSEYIVEFRSPHQSMRVVDFWPRNEIYSNVLGSVQVETSTETKWDAKVNVSAGFEPFVRGNGGGGYQTSKATKEKFQRAPEAESLTSSGTLHRGFGVFFKFRPGPNPKLEGAQHVAFLAEVSPSWRADLMLVTMHALGKSSSSFGLNSLGNTQLWTAIHQEGDSAAAAQARRFVTQEQSLRALAASKRKEIRRKSLPTVWHQIGAALDVVQPRIPENYMSHVIYGPRNQYFEGNAHRLPVDLRVAILDYWDEREALTNLALGTNRDAG